MSSGPDPSQPLEPSAADRERGADGVSLQAHLPLAWRVSGRPEGQAPELMAENQTVLRALLALDDADESAGAEPRDRRGAPEIERRLDLLLLMVSSAIRQLVPMPPPRLCTLTAQGLAWQSAEPIGIGAWGELHLYLRPRLPVALVLPAQVEQAQAVSEGAWRVRARFSGLPDSLAALLEQFVFRHHRRRVARQRAAG